MAHERATGFQLSLIHICSRAAGGTGLGLSIVRDTVRRHGGWVTVRARQPEGSVFTVGFPAVPEKRKEGDRG